MSHACTTKWKLLTNALRFDAADGASEMMRLPMILPLFSLPMTCITNDGHYVDHFSGPVERLVC